MWNTDREIEFIKDLGSHSDTLKKRGIARKELLTNYIVACEQRVNWDYLDRTAVMDFAHKELALLG